MSKDYHNYVIKDGKFIGRFEDMYKNCPDPWHQDSKDFPYKLLSLDLLKLLGYSDFRRILDIGCGKGKFTNLIKKSFPDAEVNGIDISETAISIARSQYPEILFRVVDVTKEKVDYSYDNCIFMTEVIWYVLPHLEAIFYQLNEGLKKSGGMFVMDNHLYRDNEQKYGREYITTIETLLEKLPFEILYLLEHNRFSNYDITIIARASHQVPRGEKALP